MNLKDVLSIINEIDFHSQDDIFTVSQGCAPTPNDILWSILFS